jgi:hypothetical protein
MRWRAAAIAGRGWAGKTEIKHSSTVGPKLAGARGVLRELPVNIDTLVA